MQKKRTNKGQEYLNRSSANNPRELNLKVIIFRPLTIIRQDREDREGCCHQEENESIMVKCCHVSIRCHSSRRELSNVVVFYRSSTAMMSIWTRTIDIIIEPFFILYVMSQCYHLSTSLRTSVITMRHISCTMWVAIADIPVTKYPSI